ncbi:hypothetical protein NUSPORA_01410 [Nucleospora cyclopteri]
MTINVNHISNKKLQLQALLNIKRPHIVALQETHRTEMSIKWQVEGYRIVEIEATKKLGCNGLAFLIKQELSNCVQLKELEENYIGIKLFLKDGKAIEIGNIYRPCGGQRRETILKKIQKKIKKPKECIIMGDWNEERNSVLSKLGCSLSSTKPEAGKGTRATRGVRSRRRIDFLVTNNWDRIEVEEDLGEFAISDHVPVAAIIHTGECNTSIYKKQVFERSKPKTKKVDEEILRMDFLDQKNSNVNDLNNNINL